MKWPGKILEPGHRWTSDSSFGLRLAIASMPPLAKELVRFFETSPVDQGCRLQIAGEPEVECAAAISGDLVTADVDVVYRLERRAWRHEVSGLDLDIRRAEGDLRGASRLVADQGNRPRTGVDRRGDFARRRIRHETKLDTELASQLGRQRRRDALPLAGLVLARHEQEIAQIDGDGQ